MFSRKWTLRFGLAGLGFVVLVVVALVVEWHVTRSRGEALRDAEVAKLDAGDTTWRTLDLTTARNKALPPKDKNAAERAKGVKALLPAEYTQWTKDSQSHSELKPGVLPYDDEICVAVAVHAECDEALAVARSLRDLPHGGLELTFKEPDLIGTLMPYTQDMRDVAALLNLDVTVLSYLGEADEALRSAHAILNCGRGLGDEPTLISQLVRMAVLAVAKGATERVLGLGEPSKGLAALQTAFTEERAVPRVTYGLRGERAMMFKVLQNVDDGSFSLHEMVGGTGSPLGPRLAQPYLRKYLPAQQAAMLDMFNQFLAADKLDGPARKAATDAVKLPPRGMATYLVYLLMPAVEKVTEAETRTRATCSMAAVALACERYRRKFGGFPEALKDVPKDILPAVPTDPFTGTPILYKRFDDGAVVYVTGQDLFDNGGTTLDTRGDKGTDIGFRLWNPDKRRQTPPPKPEPDFPFDDVPIPDDPPDGR